MLLLGYILVTCHKNNIVTLDVTFMLYRRNKTCLLGIYQNNSSNVHSCIHGVCILYALEYLTFRINGMVRYLSVSIEQNYIQTETLAVLPTGNLIFQL